MMYVVELVSLCSFATFAVAQTEYVQTFSKDGNDAEPAPIPGIDRALQWSGITPVTADDANTGTGVKPDGTYYGAFDDSASVVITTDYPGSVASAFTPTTYKIGCAKLDSGAYTPSFDCSVKIQGSNETGVVGNDYTTYPGRACSLPGSTSNDCLLYNMGLYQPDYTDLTTLTFTLEPPAEGVSEKLIAYIDDFDYTIKSSG